MGVKGLGYYIRKFRMQKHITETPPIGDYIYTSSVVYLDSTFKLLEFYNEYLTVRRQMKDSNVVGESGKSEFLPNQQPKIRILSREKKEQPSAESKSSKVTPEVIAFKNKCDELNDVIRFIAYKMSLYLEGISYYNKTVYVFFDFHTIDDIDYSDDVLFSDFIPTPIDSYDPVIHKNYVGNDNYLTEDAECKHVRNAYELKSRYCVMHNITESEYVHINELLAAHGIEPIKIDKTMDDKIPVQDVTNDDTEVSDDEHSPNLLGNEHNDADALDDETVTEEDVMIETDKMSFDPLSVYNRYFKNMKQEQNDEKLNKLLNFYIHGWYRHLFRKGCREKITASRNEAIGDDNLFRKIMFCVPLLIKEINRLINPKVNIYYYGCSVESDFAIVKHLKTYNSQSYPTVITNDTDLIVLLSDVNCIMKYYFPDDIYYVNPTKFWKQVFKGAELSNETIKLLAIMKGTDYNYSSSFMRIRNFNEALKIFSVKSFAQLSPDFIKLTMYSNMIKETERENDDSCGAMAVAVNMYMYNFENSFYEIEESTANEDKKMMQCVNK